MWGSGGVTEHSASVLKIDGETYVVESMPKDPWPVEGI